MAEGALSGIRVLDLSRVLAGPWAAQMLGDLGAEVIKIERPDVGDDSRRFGPPFLKTRDGRDTTFSAMFLSANRNKRSLTLNLAEPEGQQILKDLAAQADVLIENYKVGDLARYGLDYASLSALNPRLVYCSITGFGQTGPYKERGGYDPIVQAMCGMMSITGVPDGQPGAVPLKAGPSVADMSAGFYAVAAIQAALYERDLKTGRGRHVDISLLDAAVSLMSHPAAHYFISGTPPGRVGNQANGGTPGGGYRCADGYIMIAPGSQALYARFCHAIGRPDLIDDPRFVTNPERVRHRAELGVILDDVLGALTVAELHGRLVAAGVPSSPVNDLADVFADPQVRHRGLEVRLEDELVGEVRMVGGPLLAPEKLADCSRPPDLGEHSREILSGLLGLSSAEIDALSEKGVV